MAVVAAVNPDEMPARQRARLTGVWVWVVVAALAILALTGAAFFVLVWFVLAAPTGATQLSYAQFILAYWQGVVGVLAIVVAARFGWYAVHQVGLAERSVRVAEQGLGLARVQIEEARVARVAEQEAEDSRILTPLLHELHQNRLATLALEGTLSRKDASMEPLPSGLRRESFEAISAGPLWGLPSVGTIWPALADAYRQLRPLSVPWRDWLLGVGLVTGVRALVSRREYRIQNAVGVIILLILRLFWRSATHGWTGRASRARIAVEGAMERVYEALHGQALDWDDYDREHLEAFTVLPPKLTPPLLDNILTLLDFLLGDRLLPPTAR